MSNESVRKGREGLSAALNIEVAQRNSGEPGGQADGENAAGGGPGDEVEIVAGRSAAQVAFLQSRQETSVISPEAPRLRYAPGRHHVSEQIGSAFPRNDSLEVGWVRLGRTHPLTDREIGYAVQTDRAVAPRLASFSTPSSPCTWSVSPISPEAISPRSPILTNLLRRISCRPGRQNGEVRIVPMSGWMRPSNQAFTVPKPKATMEGAIRLVRAANGRAVYPPG